MGIRLITFTIWVALAGWVTPQGFLYPLGKTRQMVQLLFLGLSPHMA